MDKEQVQIKIPDTGGSVSADEVKKEADLKFKDINYILLSVVVILLVMVGTLIIDSFHVNSATYKEYSEKTEVMESTLRLNKELLDQNQKNQEIIIEQQKQINQCVRK